MRNALLMALILAAVTALPFIFRRPGESSTVATDESVPRVVVVSAHNESVRYEITQAFCAWYRQRYGKEVAIDWRTLGGTSEIMRYIRSTYLANFQHDWQKANPENVWSDQVSAAVFDHRQDPNGNDAAARARRDFLAGSTGIDIDVVFGGGQYDFGVLANCGILVPCGVKERHPEWFVGEAPILTPGGGGEIWYDPQDRYYGACFSSFGIIYNRDRLVQAGYSEAEIAAFGSSWKDLADKRLYGGVGVADPTQSGSITKCFEMIIQRQMQDVLADIPNPTPEQLDEAWRSAMTQIKKIGGNAAYLTFSASKVPVDAAAGQIAAGMCIDYYGRSQAEWESRHVGRETITYRTPVGGSSVSADPIGILRGAPNRELAEIFVDFVLSPEGQRLWGQRAGTPGGPRKYTLYRLPVRRDLYQLPPEEASHCIYGAEDNPFLQAQRFTYHGAWTGRLFNLMRVLVKVMIIDCGPELRQNWQRIIADEGCAKDSSLSAQRLEAFGALPFQHHESGEANRWLATPESQATTIRHWVDFFRQNYESAGSRK